LHAGLEGFRSNRIEYDCCVAAGSKFTHCGRHILAGAIDYVRCSGSADRVHTLAARYADHVCATAGQQRDQHSTDGARRAPDYGNTVFHRPHASETSGRQTGDGQTSTIFEAKAIGDRRQHEGWRDDMTGARPENRSPADTCAHGQIHIWRPRDYSAGALSADGVWEWQANGIVAGTDQCFSVVESGGRDFDQCLAGLQRSQILFANFDDFRSTRTQSASDTTPGRRAHT
jgi:hypothetical protein